MASGNAVMSAPSYGSRWPTYAKQWDAMQRTRLTAANEAAERILANKLRYKAVESKTGVPWWWIACTHYREGDLQFNTQLAQGDPLGQVSRNVPAGLGPYYGADAWERAAIEGLEHDAVQKVVDWRLEKALYWWERWNGWGFFNHGVPSSYVWGGTNIEVGGRYVRDHEWSPGVKDPRLGCAAILKSLVEMDSSILLVRETTDTVPSLPPAPNIPEKPTMPTQTPAPSDADLEALAQVVMQVVEKLNKQKQAPEFMVLYKALVAWLPTLGVYGVIASVVLNAFGVLGSAPMAGAENANMVSGIAVSLGAILSKLFAQPSK